MLALDLEAVLPIAEIFVAPQGEGIYTGTMMMFIRTAGCSVGKPWTDKGIGREDNRERHNGLAIIPGNHEMCSLYDGRTFCCDTDYKVKDKYTVKNIAEHIMLDPVGVHHVCLTGGEPLLHAAKLLHLIKAVPKVKFHLETSGTVSLENDDVQMFISELIASGGHITTSPKLGYLDEDYSPIVDEVKLLVDEDFDIGRIPTVAKERAIQGLLAVYLQPVNGINDINYDNVKRCLSLQLQYPWLRLSIQGHKIWQTR